MSKFVERGAGYSRSVENQVIWLSLAVVGTFPLVAISVPYQIQLQHKKKVSLACSLSVKGCMQSPR